MIMSIIYNKQPDLSFINQINKEPVIKITNDGKIIIGKDVSQDEATQTFIDFLVKQWNSRVFKINGELKVARQQAIVIETKNPDDWSLYANQVIEDGFKIVSHSTVKYDDGDATHYLIVEK